MIITFLIVKSFYNLILNDRNVKAFPEVDAGFTMNVKMYNVEYG